MGFGHVLANVVLPVPPRPYTVMTFDAGILPGLMSLLPMSVIFDVPA